MRETGAGGGGRGPKLNHTREMRDRSTFLARGKKKGRRSALVSNVVTISTGRGVATKRMIRVWMGRVAGDGLARQARNQSADWFMHKRQGSWLYSTIGSPSPCHRKR